MELKPCPFCGGTAEIKFGPMYEYVYVACEICGASTHTKERSVKYCATDEAAKAWNRRVNNGV